MKSRFFKYSTSIGSFSFSPLDEHETTIQSSNATKIKRLFFRSIITSIAENKPLLYQCLTTSKFKYFPLRLIPRPFLSDAKRRLFRAFPEFHFRDESHLDSHGVQHLENGFKTRLAVCPMARRNSAGSSDSLAKIGEICIKSENLHFFGGKNATLMH